MAKIRMVGASYEGEGLEGVVLDIHFRNGQSLLLPLGAKAQDPDFTALLASGGLFSPLTDGQQVYWRQGPSLSCAEILQMVRGEPM